MSMTNRRPIDPNAVYAGRAAQLAYFNEIVAALPYRSDLAPVRDLTKPDLVQCEEVC